MKKSRTAASIDDRLAARLADACAYCGGKMLPSNKPLSLPVNGEEVKGLRVPHIRCSKCGEGMLSIDEMRQLREQAFDKYRKKHHLMTAEEIQLLRERLGMSQRKLAEHLRLGEVTVARWESNRNVQTAAMDLLLKLIRDVPAAAKYVEEKEAA